MNDLEFRRHLKELAHGHHHPEEHDWNTPRGAAANRPARPKRGAGKKARRKK